MTALRLVTTIANITDGGRLEILQDGVWATVCNNGFDQIDADAACRSLGRGFVYGFACQVIVDKILEAGPSFCHEGRPIDI